MAESSAAEAIGKFGLGLGAGFALYLLIRNVGFGGGDGEGRGEGRGEGHGEGAGVLPSTSPPSPPSPPTVPSRPRDDQRLTFVMTQPLADEPYNLMTFLLRAEGKTYSLGGMIERVKAGGRSDVALKIRGDVRSGSGDEALTFLKNAGIDVWEESTPGTARVSGNDRGQYGRRSA